MVEVRLERPLKRGRRRKIQKRARAEGLSLSRTVIKLLEESLGLRRKPQVTRHHDLDRFAGTWTAEEAAAFDAALKGVRQIDPELWQ